MRWDPDAHDHYINGSDDDYSAPFDPPHRATTLRNERNPIDDNLHKQLNLKHPTQHQEEQCRDPAFQRQSTKSPR